MQTVANDSWRQRIDGVHLLAVTGSAVVAVLLGLFAGKPMLAIVIALPIVLLAWLTRQFLTGKWVSYLLVGLLQATIMLHVHITQGVVVYHFGFFVALAFALAYRNYWPIIVSAEVVAVHHVLFNWLQSQGLPIFVFPQASWAMVFIHAAYVVVEAGFLLYMTKLLIRQAFTADGVAQAVKQVTAGDHLDLTIRSDGSTESLQRFNHMMESLQQAIFAAKTSVSQSSEQLPIIERSTASMAQASSSQSDSVQALHQQADALAQRTGAANEAGATSEHASQQAEHYNEQSQSLLQASDSATQKAHTELTELAETVAKLDEQCDDIAQVVSIIDGIAEQTNLLALNAAIEAARAGEQGRGFAVVADEVRNLAQKTQDSTGEIADIVGRLRTQSSTAVSRTKVVQESVGEASESSQQLVVNMRDLGQEIVANRQAIHTITAELAELLQISASINEQSDSVYQDSDHLRAQLSELQGVMQAWLPTIEAAQRALSKFN